MARIPDHIIADVLDRTDIISTVSRYVSLKKAGSNFKGLCPFHSENTPSFNVHPTKGFYKCFGCGKGGNAINFLMDMEGWSFPETVRHLAGLHNIEIEEERDEAADARERGRKIYHQIMGYARTYFEEQLWSSGGRVAQLYLKERGIDEETIRTFGLGYAPDRWDGLLAYLATKKVPPDWAERAGLVLARNRGSGYYDRFRHRVVFPIVDNWNNTLAFGGRVVSPDDQPKYINSPETPYYTKGRHLYGLAASKSAIQKEECAILVEGNFDVIALHASGVQNVVAPMGTALTDIQTKLLGRYCKKVVLAFDGDAAGQQAAVKSVAAIDKAELDARVIAFDKSDDPDTFVRREGKGALMSRVDDAPALLSWAIDMYLPRGDRGDVQKQLAALTKVGELMSGVTNPVVRNRYVSEISRRLGIEPALVTEYIGRPDATGKKIRRAVSNVSTPRQLPKAEFGVLVVLLDNPQWLPEFFDEQYDALLSSSELTSFLKTAADLLDDESSFNPAFLVSKVDDSFRPMVEHALLSKDDHYETEHARRYYDDCLRTVKRAWADRTLKEIVARMEEVDFQVDRDRYSELAEQKKKVEQFKNSISGV